MSAVLSPKIPNLSLVPEKLMAPIEAIGSPTVNVAHRIKLLFEAKLDQSTPWSTLVTLPSKRALSRLFQVRHTIVDKALDELRHQGYGVSPYTDGTPIRMYNDLL